MNNSIHYSEEICNTLKEKNIYKNFSATVMKHIISILITIFSMGGARENGRCCKTQ